MSTEKVPKGYKRTEVGVIPEEWAFSDIGTVIREPIRNGYSPVCPASETGIWILSLAAVTENGFNQVGIKPAPLNDSKINDNILSRSDIVVSRSNTPDRVGLAGIYDGAPSRCAYPDLLMRVRTNTKILPRFLLAQLLSSRGRKYFSDNARGSSGSMVKIDRSILSAFPVLVSPSHEQQAIAAALSDADAWIESLEALLAKKRQIKQGAMQELLTGKRRLPGFNEKWKTKRLGEFGVFLKGCGVCKDEAQSGDLPCVRYGELYTHHVDIVRAFNSYISESVAASAFRLRSGDILFAGSGETKAEIGKCAAFIYSGEAYAGGDIVVFRPSERADSIFLGYYLNTPTISKQKARFGQGDAVVHIGASALAQIETCLPAFPEQSAIASVLSDMDAEIEAIEGKLEKARKIKQGMMQELLTGKTRLV
jgi:type I restriction enzyme, S subunit